MSESQDRELVKFNVRGEIFCTTLQTLMKSDSVFSEMFSNGIFRDRYRFADQDEDGSVLINRDGTHFRTILNFLDDGSIPKSITKRVVEDLKKEAEFYRIKSLVEYCNNLLREEKFEEDMVSVYESSFSYYKRDGYTGQHIRLDYAKPQYDGVEIRLPLMEDGALSLSVLQQAFNKATGLCYMNHSISEIPILLKVSDGLIYPPEIGWNGKDYYVVPFKKD